MGGCVHWFGLLCICRRLEDILDEEKAVTVSRFLASFRSLSKSFDYLLRQVRTCAPDAPLTARWCTSLTVCVVQCGVHVYVPMCLAMLFVVCLYVHSC